MAQVSVPITHARQMLSDTAGERWSDADLLSYYNEGVRAAVELKPSINLSVVDVPLQAGSLQLFPVTVASIRRFLHNRTSAGITGAAVTETTERRLSAEDPDWRNAVPAAEALHVVFESINQTEFWVYPPQPNPTTNSLRVLAAVYPSSATSITDPMEVNDELIPALAHYIVHRALFNNTDSPDEQQNALLHYQFFEQRLGIQKQGELRARGEA